MSHAWDLKLEADKRKEARIRAEKQDSRYVEDYRKEEDNANYRAQLEELKQQQEDNRAYRLLSDYEY